MGPDGLTAGLSPPSARVRRSAGYAVAEAARDEVSSLLTTEELQRLNALVALDGESSAEMAAACLSAHGLSGSG